MVKGAKAGDKVKVIREMEITCKQKGVVISFWPMAADTGVVTRVVRYSSTVYVYIKPDDPRGIGETSFAPGEIIRVEKPNPKRKANRC